MQPYTIVSVVKVKMKTKRCMKTCLDIAYKLQLRAQHHNSVISPICDEDKLRVFVHRHVTRFIKCLAAR